MIKMFLMLMILLLSNYNTGLDDETCDMLNRIGSQAIKECDSIGWKIL